MNTLRSHVQKIGARASIATALLTAGLLLLPTFGHAQETVCARVKIEIKQELTLERQAFDAEMKINNTTDTGVIEAVSVVVKITDEAGTPIAVTDNPNDTSAKFFLRVSNRENISDVTGTGSVLPQTTARINWLLIPAPGSAGTSPAGKKYLVGATLKYRYAGEDQTLDVSPDVITVKPLPLLTLDYFLQQDVIGDDPLTTEIEAVEPATLGVRVKNNGYATAKNLKIDSAQPKIVENNQGLLINFKLTGSYVDDAPTQNTLLVNFGDIAANTSKMGRWLLETSLAGKFTEFTATFSHADELGGALTSILQATNAHFLIRDVRVDLPGRDNVRDFLARDGDVIRVYESDSTDTVVTDRSGVAQMSASTNGSGNAVYRIAFPATAGFAYVKLPDPFNGTKALGAVQRSDAKQLLAENVWLSKTRNLELKRWEYWVNIFDVNTTGSYDTEFQAPPTATLPPVIQFIPDRILDEEQQVSFLVEASSPSGKPVALTAAPLPAGATFTPQATDPLAPTLARAIFDWKPAKGSAGSYLITYTANDGTLSSSRSAIIKVNSASPPPGPGTPTIESPQSGAQVTRLRPILSVMTSTQSKDPTTQVQFEIYRDEGMTQLVETGLVSKAGAIGGTQQATTWQPAADLTDNTRYWWRARGFDGTQTYSLWASAQFFVNLFNDPPETFNLTSPAPNGEVASVLPVLSWTNSTDRDGDAITYVVRVYSDAALSQRVAQSEALPAGESGTTSWTVPAALTNHATYYWQVEARDALGAATTSAARPFVVNTGNTAPTTPVLVSPAAGGISPSATTVLTIESGTDAEGDLITYIFELDTVSTFDSGNKRSSGAIIRSAGATTSWTVTGLVEDTRYYWRVKAQDGRAETAWAGASFVMSTTNNPPTTPTIRNPGNGAWSSTLQPVLEVNPATDPEGQALVYWFEIYDDAQLTHQVWRGTTTTTSLVPGVELKDNTTYWWRVMALDPQGGSSPMTPAAVLYVSTSAYQPPSIQITSPADTLTVTPDASGQRIVTLNWTTTNPNIESNVALYYSTTPGDFAGTLIVGGIRYTAGTRTDSYRWDVSTLATGTYYIYGVVFDARGAAQAYASGAVIVPSSGSAGQVLVSPNTLMTNENGGTGNFQVRLANAPTSDVTIGLNVSDAKEGSVTPSKLVFTPANWSTLQTVTVTGLDDCTADGDKTFSVVLANAVSLDPNYAGVVGSPVTVTNKDMGSRATTTYAQLQVCKYAVKETQSSLGWHYVYTSEWTNTGPAISKGSSSFYCWASRGVTPPGITMEDTVTSFGAIATGETIKVTNTVGFRSTTRLVDPIGFVRSCAWWLATPTLAP
ncbi:hypothetical protein OU995_17870 [Roseateles sp. SL47]|uniref:hypothetical protein n=1 Tax=Roseateles sp. SL47 TaxID=2995138 RepID=UPI002271DD4B|nr:hypothetical protein [Roseateles sp. SL47]WAC71442.1 hypothetical protein OU995_17870 [Roseateles sp. SL47]